MSVHHEVGGALPPHAETATLEGKNKVMGFWLFLGGECVLFGMLFASFIALRNQVPDGPTGQEIFQLSIVALSTFILLTSSLTSVFGTMALHRGNLKMLNFWMIITVLLGLGFLGLEIYEFVHYVHEGHIFSRSAFATSFYTLVGFHGAHVAFGVLWISLLVISSIKKGLTVVTAPKYYVAGLYWHFIDVVWVFIFTVVYLLGKVGP
ncbi:MULTISPECIES: cytochrome c oxidase subunit 3 [Paenibacillus]|uniref:Cytochrome c oxidase subunit 3 n=1 Tax=Paenibacillus radicis (ex Xue et al. 2023) TaxID=2972489 RepID=A0ABT1YKZ4_9BACL|nr:cytochrome c oxidase subunit 3 [Paenibacillus radicis (ex Xue et al. 2023)]MCR8633857.1 cytochrome c oxidase subunit 3 [Paenibacillus radicis (ex Xue et al. 2023)]